MAVDRALVDSRDTVDNRVLFEKLVASHMRLMYAYALRMTRNYHKAEDLVQETLCRAWRSFQTFQPGSDFWRWLKMIMKNSWIDTCRRERRRSAVELYLGTNGEFMYSKGGEGLPPFSPALYPETFRYEPAEIVAENELSVEMRKALIKVPPQFREVLVLREVLGLSYREIAERLHIPVGTVMSRLYRGRRCLKSNFVCRPAI